MLLDLNDPKSIVAWWEVFPERHGPLLANWAQRRPEVRGAIALASQMIRANPRTAVMLREAELRRAANEVVQVPPSHDEQLAREDGGADADERAVQDLRDGWHARDERDERDTWEAQARWQDRIDETWDQRRKALAVSGDPDDDLASEDLQELEAVAC